MTNDEKQLLENICEAFAGVTLEDGISVNMAKYIDVCELYPKFLEAAKNDERINWQTISDDILEQFDTTLCFVDLKGLRFYLPAYMGWAIRKHCVSDSIIGNHAIYAIDPTNHQFDQTPFRKWFTREQILTMRRFLLFAVEHRNTLDAIVAAQNLAKLLQPEYISSGGPNVGGPTGVTV